DRNLLGADDCTPHKVDVLSPVKRFVVADAALPQEFGAEHFVPEHQRQTVEDVVGICFIRYKLFATENFEVQARLAEFLHAVEVRLEVAYRNVRPRLFHATVKPFEQLRLKEIVTIQKDSVFSGRHVKTGVAGGRNPAVFFVDDFYTPVFPGKSVDDLARA